MSDLFCRSCDAPLDWAARNCPACNCDNGAPNVRECDQMTEKDELNSRYEAARARAEERGQAPIFRNVEATISRDSGVVVSMPSKVLLKMCAEPKAVYTNYETLVDSGIMTASSQENDRARRATGGSLFGSYAKDILYGALSCSGFGVADYGVAHCRLKDNTISERTTFLHEDSIEFCGRHGIGGKVPIPPGYRSNWSDRHLLSMAKLEERLEGFDECCHEINDFLISSNSEGKPDYIEAHIHGSFNRYSIESVLLSESSAPTRQERIDFKLAKVSLSKPRVSK